jgi:hypothetical protein
MCDTVCRAHALPAAPKLSPVRARAPPPRARPVPRAHAPPPRAKQRARGGGRFGGCASWGRRGRRRGWCWSTSPTTTPTTSRRPPSPSTRTPCAPSSPRTPPGPSSAGSSRSDPARRGRNDSGGAGVEWGPGGRQSAAWGSAVCTYTHALGTLSRAVLLTRTGAYHTLLPLMYPLRRCPVCVCVCVAPDFINWFQLSAPCKFWFQCSFSSYLYRPAS